MSSNTSEMSSLLKRSVTTIDALLETRKAEDERGSAAVAAKEKLSTFVRLAWHVLEPTTPLIWNWHIDAICDHCQAVIEKRINRLLINVPPGHMKSLIVSVFWPAWTWLHRPSWKAIFASYAEKLSVRDSLRCRDLIQSQWYRETFRPKWNIRPDQNQKGFFEITSRGFRLAVSVGGAGTGFRGDCVIFDDPVNVEEYPSEKTLANAISWWDQRMSSRLNNMATGARVGIMQRIHENDPSGYLIRRGTYTHLNLPTEFDPDDRCTTSIGFVDPRTKPQELLFPELFGPGVVAEAKRDLGEYGFAGQHNQRPSPPGGGVFKKHWLRFWFRESDGRPAKYKTKLPDGTVHFHEQRQMPHDLDELWTSWDMAFKKTATADRVAGQVWASAGASRYLIHGVCRRMSFTETVAAVRQMASDFPTANGHLIEDKANGPAVMSTLEDEIGGFIPVEPHGSKEARAHAVAPLFEAGNVYLPHPDLYPWVQVYIHMLTTFPNAANDDEVDATTQLLNHLRQGGGTSFLEALVR